MSTERSAPDGSTLKITVLFSAEEQAEAENLARFWDATVTGRQADLRMLDPELTAVVHLLRHYHDVTRFDRDVPGIQSPTLKQNLSLRGWAWPARPMKRVAIATVGLVFLLSTVNTLTSPRSWLFSGAADPDWIPWVADDWLGPDAVTARSLGIQLAQPIGRPEWAANGT